MQDLSSFDVGRLAYLGLLCGALIIWLLVANRDSLSHMIQQVAAWALIFLGTIAAVGLWDDIRRTVVPRQAVFADLGRVEVPRAPDGHYYLTLDINGAPVDFVVDTGATSMVLTQDDAARAGLRHTDLAYFTEAMTANGLVRTAPVTLTEVGLGAIVDRDVTAFVNAGEMEQSLLGMTYLQRFTRLEISGGTLVLER